MKRIIIISLSIFGLVACEKDVFTGPIDPPIQEYGKIFVSSNPRGYKIFIDNKNWSVVTPDSALWITEGKHKLSLKHELFSDSSMFFTLNKNQDQSFFIDMISNPRFWSNLICSTIPSGASIYVNDQSTGEITPSIIKKVYPGFYEIKFIKSGCRDDSVNVKAKGGQYALIERILDDTTRGVDYRTINSKIPSDQLTKVVVDKKNIKWIASLDHGLMKFDGKNWYSYENSGIFSSTIIIDMLIDSKDRLWIGTPSGLYVYDGIGWKKFTSELPSETVTAIEEDAYGNIWIGTIYGLAKYDNIKFTSFNKSSGMPENWVNSLAADKNGGIWIGTNYFAVVRFYNNQWTRYDDFSTLDLSPGISKYIAAMKFDKNGNLWISHKADPSMGTRDALTRFDGSTWEEIKLPLPFNVEIVSINTDSENNKWFCDKYGLVKYNEMQPIKLFNNYEYGFYVTHCTSIAFDKNGDLWVTTMGGGIVKLKKGFF